MGILNSLSECKTSGVVYDFFKERSDDFGSVNIIKTPFKSKNSTKTESDNSYSFLQLQNESKKQCIERIFNIKIDFPDNKIDHRITTIHSSALAAMLCFNNISKENPLKVELNNKEYTFTKFEPEYCNKCTADGGPSKIDVALFNDDDNIAFFLEAKFSEYLKSESKTISSQYKKDEIGGKLFKNHNILPKVLYFSNLIENEPMKILSKQGGKGRYREGIKQMLCHYIGATEFLKKYPEYKKVFIGTLLFDFGKETKASLIDYSDMYKELAENLNALSEGKIELVNNVVTYQNLFDKNNRCILSSKVKCFYNL